MWKGDRWILPSDDPVGMSHAPSPLPEALDHAVFTTQEALAAGVSRSRLRRDDLRTLAPGLWARNGRSVTEREIVAALCRRDPGAFAAGLTAARLWGFPLPGVFAEQVTEAPKQSRVVDGRVSHRPGRNSVDGRIHMARHGARPRETALLRWSRLTCLVVLLEDRRGKLPTVRLTSRMRTFLDLGAQIRVDALVAIGDHLVRRPRPQFEGRAEPYVTLSELRAAVNMYRGRGARRLREAVAQVRMSSDSPPETALRLAMVVAGLPEPLANVAVVQEIEGGELVDLGEPDLHWPQWKVVLEHEGPTHLERKQLSRDVTRGDRRMNAGWVELRTTSEDLRYGCRRAVERARRELLRAGWSPERDRTHSGRAPTPRSVA